MGADFSQNVPDIPEKELRELTDSTVFKKHELKRWYRKFMKRYPNGQMDKDQFNEAYSKLYTTTINCTNHFSQHIFHSFDRDNKGFISFRELMLYFSIVSCGTTQEKLEWAFHVFDLNKTGKITMEDVDHIVNCIGNCTENGKVYMSNLDVSEIFVLIDKDADGYWSVEEFIEGARLYPWLFKKTLQVGGGRNR